MFKRLQQKWKVGPLQILLILISFALGGSATGFLAKKIMNLLAIQQDWLWAIIYIILITIIWPMAVILVSMFFGQFRFFTDYVKRLGEKMGLVKRRHVASPVFNPAQAPAKTDTNIAIFASGAGSNAQKIIDHFRNSAHVHIALIACNRKKAGVLQIAGEEQIPTLLFEKEKFFSPCSYTAELRERNINFIVLAGFLWKIPASIIRAYPRRIINIHPALLPKYGGQGMYGQRVHESVLAAGEQTSGITIHYVDDHYDNGDIVLQVACPVSETDTADSLANKVHALEHANYPVVIEQLVQNL